MQKEEAARAFARTKPGDRARRRGAGGVVGGLIVLLLLGGSIAHAQANITEGGYYRIGTTNYFGNSFPFCGNSNCCSAPNCTYFTTDGGAVNTSDFTAGQYVSISNASDQEVFTFQAVAPNGTIWGENTLTYSASTKCFTWGGPTSDYAWTSYGCNGSINAWSGPSVPCTWDSTITNTSDGDPLVGTWTLQVFDSAQSGGPVITHTFNLQHNSSSQLGIISPTDSQLIDLAEDEYFTATDATCPAPISHQEPGNATAACFSAGTNTGNQISWTANLQYATSGGFGTINDQRTFTTASGVMQNEVYQSEGGQIQMVANTTASDGSTVYDCAISYVEGPSGGVTPNSVITNQLVTSPASYSNSASYPSGGTPGLMAQVAEVESSYQQFVYSDLYFDLESYEFVAKWPNECPGGGACIGLMQVGPTIASSAWSWIINAETGVNLFSGNPPSGSNKISLATRYGSQIIALYPELSPLSGYQIENMALVLYGGAGSQQLDDQYYIPTCPPPGTVNGRQCQGATWQWTENTTGNPDGTAYADKVRAAQIPQ